jgi:enterochelin esterase-like enzyme
MSASKKRSSIVLSLVVCAVVALVAVAASPSGIATAAPSGRQAVAPPGRQAAAASAPVVNPDRSVTFTLKAPQATDVKLNFQNQTGPSPKADQYQMTKGADGVWSYTMSPLAPDMYGYDFILDGVNILDPMNTYTGPGTAPAVWAGNPGAWSAVNAWSYVTVPGPEADFFADAAVPHGAVAAVRYYSKLAGKERLMYVYTPPGYNRSNRPYPVLYILHGSGGNESDWPINMRANFILDNLIAQGKAEPMIMVSPNANAEGFTSTQFPDELLGSIVPYIEENYRVAPGENNRALAGLSMGGGRTTMTIFSHPREFAYAGVFSAGFSTSTTYPETLLDNPELNKWTKLLWIAVGGPEDIAYNWTHTMLNMLDKHGVNYTFVQGTGGHVWGVWRHNLLDFAQLIFKK